MGNPFFWRAFHSSEAWFARHTLAGIAGPVSETRKQWQEDGILSAYRPVAVEEMPEERSSEADASPRVNSVHVKRIMQQGFGQQSDKSPIMNVSIH